MNINLIFSVVSPLSIAKDPYICEIDCQGQFYYNTNNNSTTMAEDTKAKELSHL